MYLGLLALITSAMFLGATLYINLVEQPARRTLVRSAMLAEWLLSNRRGIVLLSILSIASSLLSYGQFSDGGDIRWLAGGLMILSSLPYTFFVMNPINVWLAEAPASGARSTVRELVNSWSLLEWAHSAIGFIACSIFFWTLIQSS